MGAWKNILKLSLRAERAFKPCSGWVASFDRASVLRFAPVVSTSRSAAACGPIPRGKPEVPDGSHMIPPDCEPSLLRYVRELAKRHAREDHEAEIAALQASPPATSDKP